MGYKAIIFDVGGVLHYNPEKDYHRDIQRTLKVTKNVFKRIHPKLVTLYMTGKISEAEYWRRFIRLSGTTQSLPKQSLFAREYIKKFKVYTEVKKLARRLKDRGYRIAVLSNSITPHADYNDKRKLLVDFEIKILSHLVGLRKPDPRIYRLTLKKLNVKPNEAIFIDDKKENVVAARKLGITGIVFRNARNLAQALKRLGIRL